MKERFHALFIGILALVTLDVIKKFYEYKNDSDLLVRIIAFILTLGVVYIFVHFFKKYMKE